MNQASLVAERLAGVRARLERAAVGPVRVVAVTKGFDAGVVEAASAAGLLDFGENYAQELLAKLGAAPTAAHWHFLGALQRNKLARLAPHVYLWQSLDSEPAAAALAARSPGARVLVQVELAHGGQRRGAPLDEVPSLTEASARAGLDVRGLMAVGPPGAAPEETRLAFRAVAQLARSLQLPELSMGMSDDYELAAAEGATIVRLGRALFGPRPPD